MTPATATERRDDDGSIACLVEPRRSAPPLLQFSLETLLLATTLIAACLGLVVAVPPLGVPVTVVVTLALIRTLIECRRMILDGRTLRFVDKLTSFLASVGFTVLAIAATYAAFAVSAMAAWTVGETANWIIGDGNGFLVLIALPLITLVFVIVVVCGGGVTFFLFYWQTIKPRLTIDVPTLPKDESGK
jgi:hypothetical protein